ncbi:hypothetical protein MASR2M15_20270 [Anaerolineales bacterium]
MNLRYLNWVRRERQRLLPSRPTFTVLFAVMLIFITDSIPGESTPIPYFISIIASLIAIIPPATGEIKKPFKPTQRAKRLLSLSYIIPTLTTLSIFLIFIQRIESQNSKYIAILVSLSGLLLFLLAPVLLVLANILIQPVERYLRQQYRKRAQHTLELIKPKIIGITGSYGKTTTKNFLAHILSSRYRTYATPKSYNTVMGICLAINTDLVDDYSIEYFISEMGAYIPGEIEQICKLTPPDISIMTELGPQHLERFGSLENIAKAKYEIIQALPPSGLAVFNWDNPYLREMYERNYPENRIAVSKTLLLDALPENPPRFIASNITETLDGIQFTFNDLSTNESCLFETSIVGEHNINNILLAAAVARYEGLSILEIASRVRNLQAPDSRLVKEITSQGITIINDAYSSNPVGAISALKVLGMHKNGKRLLITPGMIELGDLEDQENFNLGVQATQYATDIILVGKKQTASLKAGIQSTQFDTTHLKVVDSLQEAINDYQQSLSTGDTVLFLNDLPDTY